MPDPTSPSPGSPDLGYVFVMTYGRSGSTLLQGVLNAIPGYLVRGENRWALGHLQRYHQVLAKERRSQRRQQRKRGDVEGASTAEHPFYGVDGFPVKASLEGIRELALATLLRPGPDTRVTGFKEIRWGRHEDLEDHLTWLCRVFPGARFVVNTRDLTAVGRSKWWADTPDAAEQLATEEARILAAADGLGDAAFRVRYDEWAADPAALRPLFDWLGEEYDEARVRAVLDVRHSY